MSRLVVFMTSLRGRCQKVSDCPNLSGLFLNTAVIDLHEVFSHDVQFGYLPINYLAFGTDNPWNQIWVSFGCIRVFFRSRYQLPSGTYLPFVLLSPRYLYIVTMD
jgi:hypothetical protein